MSKWNLKITGINAMITNMYNLTAAIQIQYIMCCVVLKYMKCSAGAMQMWWSCKEYVLQYLFDYW